MEGVVVQILADVFSSGLTPISMKVCWKDIQLNMERTSKEPLAKVVQRLNLNLTRALAKKKKEKSPNSARKIKTKTTAEKMIHVDQETSVEFCPNFQLVNVDGVPVELSLPLEDALRQGACFRQFCQPLSSEVEEEVLPLYLNPPVVNKLQLPPRFFATFPILPAVSVANAPLNEFQFTWRISSDENEKNRRILQADLGQEGLQFTPCKELVGSFLSLTGSHPSFPLLPLNVRNIGPIETVSPLIYEGWRARRALKFQRSKEKGESARVVRVMTFNVLAEKLAKTEWAKTHFYPSCPPPVIDMGYRQVLIGKEIQDLDCDIVCLQECERTLIDAYLRPLLGHRFHFLYTPKSGRMGKKFEGCALLYDKNKFTIVSRDDIDFRSALMRESKLLPFCANITKIFPSLFLSDVWRLSTIFQVVALQTKSSIAAYEPSKCYLVVNTHFYYHPRAGHIRILQAMVLLMYVEEIQKRLYRERGEVCLLLCGDFNSLPFSGAADLLRKGRVSGKHLSWKDGLLREIQTKGAETEKEENPDENDDEEDNINGMTAEQSDFLEKLKNEISDTDDSVTIDDFQCPEKVKIFDCYGKLSESSVTHKIQSFKGNLDYIFASRNLKVSRRLDPLDERDVPDGLPTVEYGSDHIALAVEFL